MSKILNEINLGIKKNNFVIRKKKTYKKVLVVDRADISRFFTCLISSEIFNKELNYNIKLISYLSEKNQLIKLYKKFGINDFQSFSFKFLKDYKFFFYALLIFPIYFFKILLYDKNWFINNFKIKKIYVGDLIYDSFIRYNLRFKDSYKLSLHFYSIIFLTILNISKLNKLFSENDFKCVISQTHVYASLSSLAIRIALNKRIKVLMPIGGRLVIYKNIDDCMISEVAIKKNKLNNLLNKNWQKELDIYLSYRRAGKIKGTTAKDAYQKKNDFSKNDRFNSMIKDKKKFSKIGLLATHCLSDANHAGGNFFFNDFYTHFVETLNIIKNDLKTLWIIKPHPTSMYYNEEDFIHKEIIKRKLKNVIICPNDVKPNSIIEIADKIVTCRSTIAIESAILGKKAIICGKNFFTNFGITENCFSFKVYKNKILNNKTYNLNRKQILEAKKLFYYFAFKDSFLNSDIIPISNQIKINIKKNTIKQKFFENKKLMSIFSKNFKKKKFMDDEYYLSSREIIKKEFRN